MIFVTSTAYNLHWVLAVPSLAKVYNSYPIFETTKNQLQIIVTGFYECLMTKKVTYHNKQSIYLD
jgi:hypothetical protein